MTVQAPATGEKDPKAGVQGSTESPAKDQKDPKAAAAAVPAKPDPAAPPPKVEDKPGTEKQPDGKKDPAITPPAEVVYDLKLPDGSPLKPDAVEAMKAWAKEQGLTQKQAQAQLEREHKTVLDRAESEKVEMATKVSTWQKQTLEHPELGGANLPRTANRTKAALARHDKSGNLTKLLDQTGLGHLPAVVEFLEGIGAANESDKFVNAPAVPTNDVPKKDAQVLYPNPA